MRSMRWWWVVLHARDSSSLLPTVPARATPTHLWGLALVGVQLERQFPVGLLDVLLGGVAGHTENVVVRRRPQNLLDGLPLLRRATVATGRRTWRSLYRPTVSGRGMSRRPSATPLPGKK